MRCRWCEFVATSIGPLQFSHWTPLWYRKLETWSSQPNGKLKSQLSFSNSCSQPFNCLLNEQRRQRQLKWTYSYKVDHINWKDPFRTLKKQLDAPVNQVLTKSQQQTVQSKLDEKTLFLRNIFFFDWSANKHDTRVLMDMMLEYW